jgi:AAA domain
MNPNPKSAKYKIAFTGTNSSGKTTMAMEVCSRLKRDYRALAELVSSQDRKITWKDDHFPVDPRAHYGMITNLIHAEVQAELKGDADVVITDRSVLDLYAIALTDHPDSKMIKELGYTVNAWSKTYTKIFYLPPLPYQEDGKRPPDEFRMRTHATLISLLGEEHSTRYTNVVRVPRTETFKGVLSALGLTPKVDVFAEDEKWQYLADIFDVTLLVKERNSSTSDQDVWLCFENLPFHSVLELIEKDFLGFSKLMFGEQIKIDQMFIPCLPKNIPFNHKIYTPQKV